MTIELMTAEPRLDHRRRRLVGRDPEQSHRMATPLELLYDLVFVVAFGQAANELAHYLAEGHMRAAVIGFCFAMFALSWAWGSCTWFASAYDEDDWVCRITTMVQMVGVIVVALGLPDVFASLDEAGTLDYRLVVAGYVVMRVPMAVQWLRAAAHDRDRRSALLTYFWTITVAQVGWTALLFVSASTSVTVVLAVTLFAVEIAGPLAAEHGKGGIPWHPHHIAERYGLVTIITLGEGIFGTVAALSALVHGPEGWSVDAVLIAVAGTGLTFAMWWMYFTMPAGQVLHRHRERAFFWAYGHHVLLGSVVAVGAGLHVAALHLEHLTRIRAVGVVLTVAVPLAVLVWMLYAQWTTLVRRRDPFQLALLLASSTVGVLAVGLAAAGVSMASCLVVLALAPVVIVVGYEAVGHRQLAASLAQVNS